MDFWSVYERERARPEFGQGRLYISSRERIHLSLSTVERYAEQLELNHGAVRQFSERARYIIASNITHELFTTVYNVNTTQAFLLRFSIPLADATLKRIADTVKAARKPNIELRVVGLQDSEKELVGAVDRFHAAFKSSLMEVDMFGGETRHVIFDLKLGMLFNLLLLNRIYKPHELATTLPLDDFNRKRSELTFV